MAYPVIKSYPSWCAGMWEQALKGTYQSPVFKTQREARAAQFKLNGWRARARDVLNDPHLGGLTVEQASASYTLGNQVIDFATQMQEAPGGGWVLNIEDPRKGPLAAFKPSWEVEAEQKLFSNLTDISPES